jgi:outer membrane lipoprotein-sorting protein
LPIGQAKEDVKQMFEVEVIPTAPDDPAGTIHGRLKPKPKTQFERKFKQIDVWVDPKAQMPRRIETLDRNEQTRQTTDLENVKANTGLGDNDFALEPVSAKDGWKLRDEPYEE